jgi:predicted nuclease with RNAse H fold
MAQSVVAGVDLSAEPKRTAVAVLRASARIELIDLQLGADNDQVIALTRDAEKIGVDCAFGWPTDFVEFVSSQHAGNPIDRSRGDVGIDWRRRLAYRDTDREVLRVTGKQPLSVATDKLGLVAMRCAVLLEDWARAGRSVTRDGSGALVEVYPGAALKVWGMATPRYKVDAAPLTHLVDELLRQLPLDLGSHEAHVRTSHDSFDAVIAALVSLASARGQCVPIPAEFAAAGRVEGWIAIPPALTELVSALG